MQKVKYIQDGRRTWIQINRPEKRNAVDLQVMDELSEALKKAREDSSRLVVVTGAGEQAFCSGGDLSVFHQLKTAEEAKGMLSKMAPILLDLFFFPKLTVASLNGTAVGGGCEIATACDLRVAAEHAKVGFIQGTLGITTGWGGGTLLQTRLPNEVSMEMLMTAKLYTSAEGERAGFIQNVFPSECYKEELLAYLDKYEQTDGAVIRAYKQRFLSRWDRERITEQVKKEIDDCSVLWAREEHHQAVEAFRNK